MPRFVIHKHQATRLHYDFRLESNGVLKSWAIPKEPSDKEKRLAIQVEDHSLEYGKFEGVIPEGSYGAGKVEIWDSGSYKNLKPQSVEECLKKGILEINLKGKRLNGSYALVKTNFGNGKNSWLFFKMKN